MPQQNSSTGTVQKNPSTSTQDTNKNTASASAQDQNKNSLSGSTQGNTNNPQGSQQRTSSAASQSNDNSTMQNNNSQDAIKRVVQKFVQECWNQGNLNVASELLTERVRFHDPVFPNLNAGSKTSRTTSSNAVKHSPISNSPSKTRLPNATRSFCTGPSAERTRANSSAWRPPIARSF